MFTLKNVIPNVHLGIQPSDLVIKNSFVEGNQEWLIQIFGKNGNKCGTNIGILQQELEPVCQNKTPRFISIIAVSLSAQSISLF